MSSSPRSLMDRGIRVNAVAPGPVWTPLNPADRKATRFAHFGSQAKMKRAAQPEELASPTFSWRRRVAQATSRAKSCR
jgi:NAD(P)-dependent dehydrogenase (short-subunit alcohol dehydrogenase family)